MLKGSSEHHEANSDVYRKVFESANERRDYGLYSKRMDAALEEKHRVIFPFLVNRPGGTVVDAGGGSGTFTEEIGNAFPDMQIISLDIAPDLVSESRRHHPTIKVIEGNMLAQNFKDGSLDTKIFGTVGHELESFGHPGAMRDALRIAFAELKPGGRAIIRDFQKPDRTDPVLMRILSEVGVSDAPTDADPSMIDYNILSTRALFEQFAREFDAGRPWTPARRVIGNTEYIELPPDIAHEFYLHKDYTANWKNEIKERYTYWTLEEAQRNLEEIGFRIVAAKSAHNMWIEENRLRGKIELAEKREGAALPLPFPATHMVAVGEKP